MSFRRVINTHIKDEEENIVGLGFSLGWTRFGKKEKFVSWENEVLSEILNKCKEMIKRNDKRNDEELIKEFKTTGKIKNLSPHQGLAAFILRNKEKLKGN